MLCRMNEGPPTEEIPLLESAIQHTLAVVTQPEKSTGPNRSQTDKEKRAQQSSVD